MPKKGPEKSTVAQALVGRIGIVHTVLAHIRQGRSALLLGPAGIGKTTILHAVMHAARQIPSGRWPLYCEYASTLRVTLLALARQLSIRESAVQPGLGEQELRMNCAPRDAASHILGRLSIARLRRLVAPRLLSGRYVVLLDHIGRVRGAHATFLEELAEDWRVPLIVAARSLNPVETGRMWWVGWNFQKIVVPELSPGDARQLIARLLDRAAVSLPEQEDFVRELSRFARGNPGVITRACDLVGTNRYHVGGRTDLRLLWLDLKIHDLTQRIDVESRIPLRGPLQLSPH
jgi:hypothetical protein